MAAIDDTTDAEEADGGLLLWLLVWSELAVFSILIGGFLFLSLHQPEAFEMGRRHLGTGLASFNTLILLTSGWLMAEAARADEDRKRRRWLVLAALFGFAFVAIKLLEYASEIPFSQEPGLQGFFEMYFLVTGFHLAHVAFLPVLMLLSAVRPKAETAGALTTFWHVVDLVWLVLFPVLYLV